MPVKAPENPKEAASSPNPASPPSISLPKGGGAIRGMGEKFAANPVTGTGSLSVPIATSPGRGGFGPQLALAYDSGAGNGPFGFGWSLSLPSITRKTDKGLPRYLDTEESDVFLLAGAEDLVPVLVKVGEDWQRESVSPRTVDRQVYQIQRYRPRIEGLFARIERWTNQDDARDSFWRSISKDNITTWYGKSANSRIADPADLTHIFTWLICESYDDKGNAIVYTYQSEDADGVDRTAAHERNRLTEPAFAQRYLKHIYYGNRTPRQANEDLQQRSDWMFEVVFDYGEHNEAAPLPVESGRWTVRADAFSTCRAGFEIRTYRLCRRVLMFHHFPAQNAADVDATAVGQNCLVRATEFSHEQTPVAAYLVAATQAAFRRNGAGYTRRSLPPLQFEYSKAQIQAALKTVDAASIENLPTGIDGTHYQFVDLYGEDISGVLTQQAEGWFYKRNLSPLTMRTVHDANGNDHIAIDARFAPTEHVALRPSPGNLAGGQQLMDLDGDGRTDLVQFAPPLAGYSAQDSAGAWQPFVPFRSQPNLDWQDPNLRHVELTGDGHADLLITRAAGFEWYRSLEKDGFEPAQFVTQPLDDEQGPRLVFADGTQSVYLADMNGDGLTDLVRIGNGNVCYWPSLGYGRFGAKVTMSHAPHFDYSDHFDHQRIRLADIDGSGVADILYIGRDAIQVYRNESGNRWADADLITAFPRIDNLASVQAMDLLGNGTACLVWSSPLSRDARQPLRYLDLLGGQKPHLLIKTSNNLGAETRVEYAPSTKFYLQDKYAGKPWITKLPFPVHVVERVETFDQISRNWFVTRYHYHHGYFDGVEREFRGFGMVEQFDTEAFDILQQASAVRLGEGADTNIDPASHMPPIHTKTWFHTGVYVDRQRISTFFASEYYREPGLADSAAERLLLADTVLPTALSADEERQACRALKGSILRQEVYALDGTPEQPQPYSVSERNYTIERLQAPGQNQHAVFFTHPRETLDYHYERSLVPVLNGQRVDETTANTNPNVQWLPDPRISHSLVLEVDPFGNALKTVAIGYGRRAGMSTLLGADKTKQEQLLITYTESDYTENDSRTPADWVDAHRVPLPYEVRTYELTGFALTGDALRFAFADFAKDNFAPLTALPAIAYEQTATPGIQQKRLIECVRTYYRRNDLNALLSTGLLQSLALPGESYKLAFTPGLLNIYASKIALAELTLILQDEGKYVDLTGNGQWWIPSGRVFYSSNAADAPAQELTAARAHFFLPRRYRDPFGYDTHVDYDTHDLLVTRTQDPVQNVVRAENNYRVLQAWRMTDPNGNRSEVAFDTLGMVAGTAVKGKDDTVGDTLNGFDPDLTQAQVDGFYNVEDPHVAAPSLLQGATTRIIYDPKRFHRTQQAHPADPTQWLPVYAASLVRETHVSDPLPPQGLKIQISFSYSDGFGREIQKKIQAEPGPVVEGGPLVNPRWVGSGWTIFNNKGKPVRQYEPFFSATHDFEFGRQVGVSPTLFYDPAERVVATLHPNHTYEKVVFDPWQQTTYDVNDTVTLVASSDDDVQGFFIKPDGTPRIPPTEYLPTWHAARIGNPPGDPERAAAQQAAAHADTPTVAHFDALGRPFLTLADNGPDPAQPGQHLLFASRVELDIEGNQRVVRDAIVQSRDSLGRIVMRYDYDMLGTHIHQASMEAGARWILNNVAGKPIRAWDDRNFTRRMTYDALQRPAGHYVSEPTGERLAEQTIYGEDKPSPADTNHRGKVWQVRDDAGIVTSEAYDFKGGLLSGKRDLRTAYQTPVNWAQLPAPATSETFTSSSKFDALGRVIEVVAPDGSVTQPHYNEANLLEAVDVRLGGALQPTHFVRNIDYDAKGQRTRIEYNEHDTPIITEYTYNRDTFRLTRLVTTRPSHLEADKRTLQDLRYTYDPTGNITHIQDDAQQTIYFRNQRVEPSNDYVYDALYRLISAQGREHLGQTGGQRNPPTAPDAFNQFHTHLDHPGNGDALGTYVEEYEYDAVGNFLTMQHRGSDPAHPGWTRRYAYRETSLIEDGTSGTLLKTSNRLSSTQVGADRPEAYSYDVHGNMTAMPHLPTMRWDFEDQLTEVDLQGGGTAYYVYDAGGQRVRKVIERNGATVEERIYLGGYEVYRARQGGVLQLERETLHVMDDKQRIALVETRTQGIDDSLPQLIRYQFGNHLGSASLELDDQAQIISYEEYTPYGSSSYQAVRSQTETPKRYRYTGKERDEESGLYYHGARYYACWLARWTSVDPQSIGTSGQSERYSAYDYVNNRPTTFSDPTGLDAISRDTLPAENQPSVSPRISALEPHPDISFYHLPSSPRYHPRSTTSTRESTRISSAIQAVPQVGAALAAATENFQLHANGPLSQAAGLPSPGNPTIIGAIGGVFSTTFSDNKRLKADLKDYALRTLDENGQGLILPILASAVGLSAAAAGANEWRPLATAFSVLSSIAPQVQRTHPIGPGWLFGMSDEQKSVASVRAGVATSTPLPGEAGTAPTSRPEVTGAVLGLALHLSGSINVGRVEAARISIEPNVRVNPRAGFSGIRVPVDAAMLIAGRSVGDSYLSLRVEWGVAFQATQSILTGESSQSVEFHAGIGLLVTPGRPLVTPGRPH